LIVDDEPSVRRLLQVALQQQGFNVWLSAGGQEALQLYRQYRPLLSLVLLDVRMPGLDGPQTLASLQKLNPAVVCCFMTAHGGEYTEAQLLRQGATHVFAKPFALADLRESLWQLPMPLRGAGCQTCSAVLKAS
jgi:CheY-like chemotaxis protein